MSLCSLGQDISALASAIPDFGRSAFSGDASIASIAAGIVGITGQASSILSGVGTEVFSLRSQIPGLAELDSQSIALSGQYASVLSKINDLQNKIYTLPFDNKLTQKAWELHSEFFMKSESLRAKAFALEAKIGLGGLGGIAGPLGRSQATMTAEYANIVNQISNLSINDFKPSALKANANQVANQLNGYRQSLLSQVSAIKTQLTPESIQGRVKNGMSAVKSKLASIKNKVSSIGSC